MMADGLHVTGMSWKQRRTEYNIHYNNTNSELIPLWISFLAQDVQHTLEKQPNIQNK